MSHSSCPAASLQHIHAVEFTRSAELLRLLLDHSPGTAADMHGVSSLLHIATCRRNREVLETVLDYVHTVARGSIDTNCSHTEGRTMSSHDSEAPDICNTDSSQPAGSDQVPRRSRRLQTIARAASSQKCAAVISKQAAKATCTTSAGNCGGAVRHAPTALTGGSSSSSNPNQAGEVLPAATISSKEHQGLLHDVIKQVVIRGHSHMVDALIITLTQHRLHDTKRSLPAAYCCCTGLFRVG